ncbi:hypothetical protein DZ774_14190 [Enterococcus faecalis]|nr:hypothetical protein [Enterococcus faecalis]
MKKLKDLNKNHPYLFIFFIVLIGNLIGTMVYLFLKIPIKESLYSNSIIVFLIGCLLKKWEKK